MSRMNCENTWRSRRDIALDVLLIFLIEVPHSRAVRFDVIPIITVQVPSAAGGTIASSTTPPETQATHVAHDFSF